MRITYRGDYALKAVLDLALHYNEKELTTIHDMAKHIDAPVKFLEQIMLDLKKGGFIESRRGNVGGYMLSRSPAHITVGDVAKFIDGPLEPISCVGQGYSNCGDINKCVFKEVWHRVAQATSAIVDNLTFAELVERINSKRVAFAYSI